MRLVSFGRQGEPPRVGALCGDEVRDIRLCLAGRPDLPEPIALWAAADTAQASMIAFLACRGERQPAVLAAIDDAPQGARLPLREVCLHAPVPRPGKIVCIGRNYRDHVAEGNLGVQPRPRLFLKAPSAVTGPSGAITRPRGVEKLDWEAELGVVIGAPMSDLSPEEVPAGIAGYVAMNDVSAREFQFDVSPPQTSFAKSMDGFCPFGPAIVTPDEIADPDRLDIRCLVNGQMVQHGNTGEMIVPPFSLISYISRYLSLEPGDLVATGTPAGVGHFADPPRYLSPGDRVTVEIEAIGRIENRIVGHDEAKREGLGQAAQ